MTKGLDIVDKWPELFAPLGAETRIAVVQTLTSSWHEGWEPNRAEVTNLVDFGRGIIDEAEFFRRSDQIAGRRR